MPTLNWWIRSIVYRSRLWLSNDEYHPTQLSIADPMPTLFLILIFAKLINTTKNCYCYYHQTIILIFGKLQLLQNCYCHCHHCHQTIILPCYKTLHSRYWIPHVRLKWQLNCQCSEIFFGSLWVQAINLGEILPSKTIAIPYTCGLSRSC